MKRIVLVIVSCMVAGCLAGGCAKEPQQPGDGLGRSFADYPYREFVKSDDFQAKVLDKYISAFPRAVDGGTDYVFIIFLERKDGVQFAVSARNPADGVLKAVNSLEKHQTYTFPTAIRPGQETLKKAAPKK